MAVTVMDKSSYKEQLNSLLPQGFLWDALASQEANFQALLDALASEYERVDQLVETLPNEMDPRTVYDLLQEWENFSVPDDTCSVTDDVSLQGRRGILASQYGDIGRPTLANIVERAADLGHQITITESQISKSGIMVSGEELSADPNNQFFFQVNVPIENAYAYVAGASESGEELGYWQPLNLECLLERIKPAHTSIFWNYL